METLVVIIRQSRADNVAATDNEKKLKEEKESKGGVIARALSSLSKSIKSPQTTTPLPTTTPPPISTSSFFAAKQLREGKPIFFHAPSLNNSTA